MRNLVVSLVIVLALAPFAEAQRPRVSTGPAAPAADDSDRPKIDVEKYTLDVTIVPADHRMNVVAEIRFRPLERSGFVAFDLDRRMHATNVTSGGIELNKRQFDLDSTIEVDVSPLPISETQTLKIEYFGVLESDLDRLREPVFSRIAEDSVLLLYDGKWFPSNGLYADKADMQLQVNLPPGWTVVSDLSPAPATPSGASAFVSSEPSYWGMIAAGRYTTIPVKADGRDITVHTLKAEAAAATTLAETAGRILTFYEQTFGPLPSKQFRIVEAQGANWSSQWSAGTLVLPTSEFKSDLDLPALAVGIARQWFPLRVSIKDPSRDAWLQEGMAVFASLLYFEKTLSPAEFQDQIDKTLVRALSYEGSTSTRQAGALERDTAEYRALVEYKGAFIFRMLRWVMGDEKFQTLIARYMEKFQKTPASTEAMIQLASEVDGEDLSYFFDQWLNSTGVPEMTDEWVMSRVRNGYKITGTIKQDLDLFRMPIEIEFITDGDPEFRRVEVSGKATNFDVNTDRKPKEILIDPRRKTLRMSDDLRVSVFINRGEEAANESRHADALNDFQNAIDLDPKNSLALFRMGESQFDVGNIQSAKDSFTQALNGNLKPKWVEVWSYINIGKIYDIRSDRVRAVNEYQKAINTGDDSYGAQADAAKFLTQPFRRSPTP